MKKVILNINYGLKLTGLLSLPCVISLSLIFFQVNIFIVNLNIKIL